MSLNRIYNSNPTIKLKTTEAHFEITGPYKKKMCKQWQKLGWYHDIPGAKFHCNEINKQKQQQKMKTN